MSVGGSVEAVNLDGREFEVAADADVTLMLGGSSNEVLKNGGPGARLIKTSKAWSASGLQIVVDDTRGDPDFIQNLADTQDFFTISITMASGQTYQGTGTLTGDISWSSQNATVAVNLAGPNKLTPQ